MGDEPQYCEVCGMQICCGRCGCCDWRRGPDGKYLRVTQPPAILARMVGDDPPAMPDVMLSRLMRRYSQAILENRK